MGVWSGKLHVDGIIGKQEFRENAKLKRLMTLIFFAVSFELLWRLEIGVWLLRSSSSLEKVSNLLIKYLKFTKLHQ
jgi:hypothetical protein